MPPTPAKCTASLELPLRSCCNLNLQPPPDPVGNRRRISGPKGRRDPGCRRSRWPRLGCLLSLENAKQVRERSRRDRPLIGWATLAIWLPVRLLAASGTLSDAAQQHLVQQYCSVCHNYEDYTGGVEFEVFDPSKAHEDASLTERMVKKLRAGMMPPAGKPRPDLGTLQAFATSL